MGRKRRRRKVRKRVQPDTVRGGRRYKKDIPLDPRDKLRLKLALARIRPDLREVEDLREWHPRKYEPTIRNIRGTEAEFYRSAYSTDIRRNWENRVIDPTDTPVCIRRRRRRQTLFARRKIGKGMPGPKRRRYTEKSKVRCN